MTDDIKWIQVKFSDIDIGWGLDSLQYVIDKARKAEALGEWRMFEMAHFLHYAEEKLGLFGMRPEYTVERTQRLEYEATSRKNQDERDAAELERLKKSSVTSNDDVKAF